ncbi:gamma-glutamylcyclotransferase family protein [Haloarchaeobius sp. TZWWS8]|uniref:gamma-glutamylcyclotransferase family protein n=1 Tax=Haloarchaeobius sp. TZWWS8 TaxID=3446121 RepID=UPI003EB71E48
MNVFVYGTLTDADRVDDLLDDWSFGPRVTLQGCHRVDGDYPTLAPGGSCAGRIIRVDAIDTLDRYEGVERGLYTRVPVSWAAQPGEDRESGGDRKDADNADDESGDPVQVYVGDPARLGVPEPIEWPGEGSLFERVETYCRDHCCIAKRDE